MKIIGESEDNFILEADKREVANLIGYYSEYGENRGKVGDEIAVSKMFRQLYDLAAQDREIQNMRESLIKAYRYLELVAPLKIKLDKKDKD